MADQKTILITGSTRGIGLALATHYKQQGWKVIGAARNLKAAEKLEAISPYKIVQLDTSDEASILKAAEQLEGESIDLLINNAGIGANENLETATKESLMKKFEVNSVGPFLVTRAFLTHMRAAVAARGSATVAQISSSQGSITMVEGIAIYGYRASKAALNMINAALSLELKADKIIAVTLNPGYVATDMSAYAGVLKPEESVAGIANVLGSITLSDSGKFLQYDGESLPW